MLLDSFILDQFCQWPEAVVQASAIYQYSNEWYINGSEPFEILGIHTNQR